MLRTESSAGAMKPSYIDPLSEVNANLIGVANGLILAHIKMLSP